MKPCSSLKIHQITFKALSILTLCVVDTIQLIHCNFTKKEEKRSISNSGIWLALYVVCTHSRSQWTKAVYRVHLFEVYFEGIEQLNAAEQCGTRAIELNLEGTTQFYLN